MKKFGRCLFNFAAALSLVLFIGILAAWAASAFKMVISRVDFARQAIRIEVVRGELIINRIRYVPNYQPHWWAGPYLSFDPVPIGGALPSNSTEHRVPSRTSNCKLNLPQLAL